MGTIRLTFDDLCAFFTSQMPHVMVGLIDTSDAPPQDIHHPHIIIEEEGGAIVGEYHDFNYHGYGQIYGDIFLDVFPATAPLKFYEPLATLAPSDERHPFHRLIDIENTLYPQQSLDVQPQRCRARLHFRNGELYARGPLFNVAFADVLTKKPCDQIAPMQIAASAGLDVFVPEHGYAVLHFSGNTNDFVFKGGKNYKVKVTNTARTVTSEHFQYFFRLMERQSANKLIPIDPKSGSIGNLFYNNPYCTIGWFSKTIYQILTGHLDW